VVGREEEDTNGSMSFVAIILNSSSRLVVLMRAKRYYTLYIYIYIHVKQEMRESSWDVKILHDLKMSRNITVHGRKKIQKVKLEIFS
jgi:hypothetical protein